MSYLGKYDIIFLLSRHLNDENITNTVRHGMHSIHFSTAKRLVRKRSVRLHCKTSVCTHKLRPAPLDKQSGRLDRNHSVLIGQRSGIKQQ